MENKIIESKEVENVVHGLDMNIFQKKPNVKTQSGIVLHYARQFKEKKNFEYAMLLQEIYKKVRDLETSEKFKANQWRGKSGVSYQENPDFVIAIRYQKADIGEEPKEIRTELTKNDINRVIWAINQFKDKKVIETSEIAEKVYSMIWKDIFSDRKKHTKIVEIFNFLEYKKQIKYYRSGKIEVLNQKKL